jgi:hypothetical protein
MEELRNAEPEMPAGLNDRAADKWRGLIAIADEIGGQAPELARAAALALSGAAGEDRDNINEQLLVDIRDVFVEREVDRISTADLLQSLIEMQDHPWATWGRSGKAINAKQLAERLKPFKIYPRELRDHQAGGANLRGYIRRHFEDAFARYLPDLPKKANV